MQRALSDGAGVHALECRKIVMLSRFVALSVSLILKVSLLQRKQDVMVWRPGAADHGVQLPKSLIFDVYSGLEQCPPDGQGCYNITASKTTAAGHQIVRSAGYYLDQLCDLDPDHKHSGNCEFNKRHHACHLTQTVACQQTGVISPGGNSMPATRSRAR